MPASPDPGQSERPDLAAALAEVERLRGINRHLVKGHNGLLIGLARSEDDAEALRNLLFGDETLDTILRMVSADFAGAHVNADVVIGAIRKRLRS